MDNPFIDLDILALAFCDDDPLLQGKAPHGGGESVNLAFHVSRGYSDTGLHGLSWNMVFHADEIAFPAIVMVEDVAIAPPQGEENKVFKTECVIEYHAFGNHVRKSRIDAIDLARVHELRPPVFQ